MKNTLQIDGGVAKRSLSGIARVNWIAFMHGLRHLLFYPLSLMWKMFGRHESDDMVHGDCYGFMWLYHAPCCMTWTFCKDFYCYIKKQPKHKPMKTISETFTINFGKNGRGKLYITARNCEQHTIEISSYPIRENELSVKDMRSIAAQLINIAGKIEAVPDYSQRLDYPQSTVSLNGR